MEQMKMVKNILIVALIISVVMLTSLILVADRQAQELDEEIVNLERWVELQRNENSKLMGELWILKDQLQKDQK